MYLAVSDHMYSSTGFLKNQGLSRQTHLFFEKIWIANGELLNNQHKIPLRSAFLKKRMRECISAPKIQGYRLVGQCGQLTDTT